MRGKRYHSRGRSKVITPDIDTLTTPDISRGIPSNYICFLCIRPGFSEIKFLKLFVSRGMRDGVDWGGGFGKRGEGGQYKNYKNKETPKTGRFLSRKKDEIKMLI